MRTASLADLATLRADLVAQQGEPSRRDGEPKRPRRRYRDRPEYSSRAFRLPADFPFDASPAEVEDHIDAAVVAHYPRGLQETVDDILDAERRTSLQMAPPTLVHAVLHLRAVMSRRVHDLYTTVPKRDPMTVRLRQIDRWEGPCSQVVTRRADGTYWVDGEQVSAQKATGLLRARQDRAEVPVAYR